MGVLTLNVISTADRDTQNKKRMQFDPQERISVVCQRIKEKMGLEHTHEPEYGLIRVVDDPTKCIWMDGSKPLEYYLLRDQDCVEYKKKIRLLKIRTLDGAVKSVNVDESHPVGKLMISICSKIGITNFEEYSLVREASMVNGVSTLNLRDGRDRSLEPEKKEKGIMGTLGRKKEKKIEALRQKLHTDEEIPWVDHGKTLREQGIDEQETLLLRRKFFFSEVICVFLQVDRKNLTQVQRFVFPYGKVDDNVIWSHESGDTNVDSRDPVQLNLLYVQCRDGILRGLHPVTKEVSCQLGALQSQIQYGDLPHNSKFHIEIRDVLPKEYAKKDNEKLVLQNYSELSGTAELDAKSKYVHLCRGLKTYGVTFFVVREKVQGKNRLVPRLLGVNKESVMRVDEKTKDVIKEWPLEQIAKYVATANTFTMDFGDYQEKYYSVKTPDGEKICQLIGGYIDIILKRKQMKDHLGIEGDEGSTMLEDIVAPARATLVAHGQIGDGQYAQDGHVALRGVLRTPQNNMYGYGINGAQYGAVSGEVQSHTMTGAQRTRLIDTYEQPQRALIGTIEATIRAVEDAEQELEKEPEIQIPRFADDVSERRWVDEQVAVNKENVNERLAAMGAATAQVVQWTAVEEEYDERVGTAIATIGNNLPDVGRNVRDLAYLMEERKGDDLMQATRRLCGAFGDFLNTVNPEHQERRTTVLAAAGRVGDFSQQVITTMDEQSNEEHYFQEQLMQKAKNVATSTAQLVMRAKTVSAECDEPHLQEKVIHSATQTAFATSQLVATARVVAPTIESNACQEQLTNAATQVSHSVEELMHDAETACHRSEDGQRSYGDLHTAARQVTTALDSLLEHVKTSPKITKTTEHEEYNVVLRTTNRMLAHQGPSEELTREARRVIRHSQMLQEQFEHEAVERPEHKDRLLDAARKVATATSHMIDATRECESRPTEAESEMALRRAAEQMQTVTHETTSERQAKHIMERLEQAAKQTAYDATQTIAASSAAKEVIHTKTMVESLVFESTQTADNVQRVIGSLKESQNAATPSAKFRGQSRLIRDSYQLLEPATRLMDTARTSVSHVQDGHKAANLQTTSNTLSTSLAELRTAINDAQQLNFSQQLVFSEELIRELDDELVRTQTAAQRGQLPPPAHGVTAQTATSRLMGAARQVGSTVAQLVSSAASEDQQHVGASAVEAAQSLRSFTSGVTEVVTTRTDIQLDEFIVHARSVVHDSGRVFDRVREQATPAVLSEATKQVAISLRKVITCLPDNQNVEKAIQRIRTINVSASVREPDLRQAAARLIDATSALQAAVRSHGQNEAIDVFVNAYTDFHVSVFAAIKQQPDVSVETRAESIEQLEQTREEAVSVLSHTSAAFDDSSKTKILVDTSRQFTESVNSIVERVSMEQPWQKECDAALRQIQSVRHLTEQAYLPVNADSYYGSLDSVTEHSRRLGEAMTGIARHAKAVDARSLCSSVRSSADAVCSLAEAASQSAYLVGVSHPKSTPGQIAAIDVSSLHKISHGVRQLCQRIEQSPRDHRQVFEDTTEAARQTSLLANMCRQASETHTNVNIRKQFINSARDIASCTSNLIIAVKEIEKQPAAEAEARVVEAAQTLRYAAEQLDIYVENPSFAAVPARISQEGHDAQIPVLASSRQMLDASSEMIKTAKQLAVAPKDSHIWQRLADNSKDVSESIKRLVSAIRDAAPGQAEMDTTIKRLEQLMYEVERQALDSVGSPSQASSHAEKRIHQQIMYTSQLLGEKVDPLRTAATHRGEELARCVVDHWELVQPLVASTCDAAAIATDSRQQAELFDKCRTIVEAELQMMYACRDSAGNPKAQEQHHRVDEAAAQLKDALADIRIAMQQISSEQGVIQGMIETISHAIASADGSSAHTDSSFPDIQTRMTQYLEEIRRIASELPFTDPQQLGNMSLDMSEKYRQLAVDGNQAVSKLQAPNVAQKLKVAIQKLGTACIDTVKIAGQRKAHPADQRVHRELGTFSKLTVERVDEVLAALHEGSKGTQACINAANTVSGIIGDLDTTILFATSGSLNPSGAPKEFNSHREAILKTAKALVEDTKALVAGAASNQEQLAVAAQNAVRTIVNLSDAVKNGAVCLSSDNSEAQVMVIHAVRDVASALSALIQATKNASGRSLQDPAMNNLKDAAKVMVSNVTSLLKTVKSVEDKQQQGSRALEAAIESIVQEIRHYDHETSEGVPGPSGATPMHLERATKKITDATSRLQSAADSMVQSDIIAAANWSRAAVSELLLVTRAISMEAETAEIRYRMLDQGREVADKIRALLVALYNVLSRNQDAQSRQLLLDASRSIASAVNGLIGCSEQLTSEKWVGELEPTVMAESELIGAASSLDAAAVKLAELRPRHQPQRTEQGQQFDEAIIHSAKSITTAVQILVKAASVAQRELVAQGRIEARPARTSDDYQWSEGLISAARCVVAAVHQLCEAAESLVQGQAGEERLSSAAKQVAASTAQLLVSCNVKADMDSQAKRRLQAAGHAVKTATEHLVQSARQMIVEDERSIVIADRMVHGIAQVMDAQELVLRRENELKAARNQLAELNRARYVKEDSPPSQ